VKVVTISSWLNIGRPAPPGRGSAAGRKCLAPPYYSQRAVFTSLWALFSFYHCLFKLLFVRLILNVLCYVIFTIRTVDNQQQDLWHADRQTNEQTDTERDDQQCSWHARLHRYIYSVQMGVHCYVYCAVFINDQIQFNRTMTTVLRPCVVHVKRAAKCLWWWCLVP